MAEMYKVKLTVLKTAIRNWQKNIYRSEKN